MRAHQCLFKCAHKLRPSYLSRCFAGAEAANKDEEADRRTISEAETQSFASHKPSVRFIIYFWIHSSARFSRKTSNINPRVNGAYKTAPSLVLTVTRRHEEGSANVSLESQSDITRSHMQTINI